MLTYIYEFNLNVAGQAAEKYLAEVVREWPDLYSQIPGVQGTFLFANALALAGDYSYQCRVDLESFDTLPALDEALKGNLFRKARVEWFKRRTQVRARLLRHDGGSADYSFRSKDAKEGLVHFVISHGSTGQDAEGPGKTSARAAKSLGKVRGVHAVQSFTAAIPSSTGEQSEVWVRVGSLANLGDVAQAFGTAGVRTSVLGELREINGALFAGA